MSLETSSISFQEDFVTWTDLSVEERVINIQRAVSESLPVSINYQNFQQSTTAKQIANQLIGLMQRYELSPGTVRMTLPGRFTVIKKVVVDQSIPKENYKELALFELENSLEEPQENFHVYMPEFTSDNADYRELLVVAIRKSVLEFFNEISETAKLNVQIIAPSCFTIDELYRKLHPGLEGQTLLLGWQRRGYDVIISDKNNFINYMFRPYNTNFDSIEQLDEGELLSSFDVLLEELKHPPVLQKPLYDIQSVLFYGFHFKNQWLDLIKAQVPMPVRIFNAENGSNYQIVNRSQDISDDQIFQMIESVSNIF